MPSRLNRVWLRGSSHRQDRPLCLLRRHQLCWLPWRYCYVKNRVGCFFLCIHPRISILLVPCELKGTHHSLTCTPGTDRAQDPQTERPHSPSSGHRAAGAPRWAAGRGVSFVSSACDSPAAGCAAPSFSALQQQQERRGWIKEGGTCTCVLYGVVPWGLSRTAVATSLHLGRFVICGSARDISLGYTRGIGRTALALLQRDFRVLHAKSLGMIQF